MNAPHTLSPASRQMMADPSAPFLQNLSIEITAKQIEKLPLLQAAAAAGHARSSSP